MICSGCSTMDSLDDRYNLYPFDKKVYAGTKNDIRGLTCIISNEPGWAFLALGELPFCFIADTLLLPYTIYLDYHKNNKIPTESVELTGKSILLR